MNVAILTPVRLLGDGLARCLSTRPDVAVPVVVKELGALRELLAATHLDAVLVDVTRGVDLFDVRALATEWPGVPLVALGLEEHRQEVIRCGRAGYAGYVGRDASIDALCAALADAVAGRLACPPEIAGGLLRALHRHEAPAAVPAAAPEPATPLTRRESEVLELLGRGFTNKEIGNALCLSVATVKHHVHHVLEKLNLSRRADAMRRVRDAPWLGRGGVARDGT